MSRALPKLYLAAPLFNVHERAFNLSLAQQLAPYFNVYLPQRDGHLITDLYAQGMNEAEAYKHIFKVDVNAINTSQALLIIMDGRTVDEGSCFELGLAFAKGLPCVALKTDMRVLMPSGNSPMLNGALSQIFNTEAAVVAWARSFKVV